MDKRLLIILCGMGLELKRVFLADRNFEGGVCTTVQRTEHV